MKPFWFLFTQPHPAHTESYWMQLQINNKKQKPRKIMCTIPCTPLLLPLVSSSALYAFIRSVFIQRLEGMTRNDLREVIVAAHRSGKAYKTISKLFGVQQPTVKQIIL